MLVGYSASQIEPWLASAYRLYAGQFTYSVPDASSQWFGYDADSEIGKPGFALPDGAMGEAFVNAIALWDDLIAPDFRQVPDNGISRGELRIAITDMDEKSAAYAYYPTSAGGKPGDVWFNSSQAPWDWGKGGFDFYSMLHEIGHTLGLKHSFEGFSAPAELDSQRFTVMSYTPAAETYVSFAYKGGSFFAYFRAPSAETPMVLDIAAVQRIYGADPDTRAGDTIYSFTQWHPGLQTIYDAGGNDTIDLSALSLPSKVDLASGAYSSIGIADTDAQIAYWSSLFPENASFVAHVYHTYVPMKGYDTYQFTDNLGIALSTIIENAVGGSGDDEITGNEFANVLEGGSGDDTLTGLGGSDELYGGVGNDILNGDAPGSVDDTPDGTLEPAVVNEPDVQEAVIVGMRVNGPASSSNLLLGRATLLDFDLGDIRVSYSFSDLPYEDYGDDTLSGGPGRDFLTGGSGADRFLFEIGDFSGIGADDSDRIYDFDPAEGDRIDLSGIDPVPGGLDDAFTFIGTARFGGTAGELRYETGAGYALVSGDLDGDSIADFAIRLDHVSTLSASAFLL